MKFRRTAGKLSSQADGGADTPADGRPRKESVFALMALALILVAGFLQLSPSTSNAIASEITRLISNTAQSTETNSSTRAFSVYSPLIANGAANITYPADYKALSRFALGLINQDRANQSLPPVSLDENSAGQQHADSMLRYGYFSHFDTQGYKPYMRYTLLGGVGADSENVAYIAWRANHFTSTTAVEGSVSTLEHAMMYNDSKCCNNGHRLNIINPLHNKVSLGLDYNGTTLFFVEEFENYYVNLSYNVSKSYTFSMAGSVLAEFTKPSQVYVTYDGAPAPETIAQLNAGPKEYGPGILVGGVLPPCTGGCTVFASGVTVRATVWQVTPTLVDIRFDLSRFIQIYGSGVYTIYLLTGADTGTALTSISVFVG